MGVDTSNTTFKQIQRAKLINGFCSLMGFILVVTGWILGFACWKIDIEGLAYCVLIARLQSYIMYYGMYLGIYFNPIVSYGQPNPDKGYNFGDYIGCGQWRIESARYRTTCQRVLRKHRLMSIKTQDF